ncbi:FtsX-like permease family protein [Bacteroides sp.]|uniref:ABC transporter permease n=1 Tax=Bacteroides sp. TaxID=29523 RepID=UPI0026163BF1|nr:FtsX-like permease family protein [Bacteroides sp.]MDD3038580.1 ABC transporter permease [Bacteroides sp.]
MILHYLKIAFRNLIKYKTQSLVSIIGLAVGFTCFALSVLWIRYEMTYDNFHEGADRIYWAGSKSDPQGNGFSYYSSTLLVDHVLKKCPEIEAASHFYHNNNIRETIRYQEEDFSIDRITADSNFISMFNIITLNGDDHFYLSDDQVAITDKIADEIFGNKSPLGEKLIFPDINNSEKTIAAVVKSWEGHSSFPFDVLLPHLSQYPDSVEGLECYTVFRTYPNADIQALKKRLEKYEIPHSSSNKEIATPITLLSTLRSTYPREDVIFTVNRIRLFACIGALVIICGLCNYFTIFITRLRMRKRELALRKVNGASERSLLALILIEPFLLFCISIVVENVLIEIILPVFKRLSQIKEDTSSFFGELAVYMLLLVAITMIFAIIIVKFIGKRTLLENIGNKSDLYLSGWFYKGSILLQLFISIGFIFCTFVMMKQLNFLLYSRECGMDRHNLGVVRLYNNEKEAVFKILDQMPDVEEYIYGFYSLIPKHYFLTTIIDDWEGKVNGSTTIIMENETINKEYADLLNIEVLDGEMLDEKDGKQKVVINEAAAKVFGWRNPIGKKFVNMEKECVVKGVIRNIYYNAPVYPVAPAIYFLPKDKNEGDLIIKVKDGAWKTVNQKLKEEINKMDPNARIQLIQMEERYNEYMKSEETLNKLLRVVSFVCVLIAVFGIFSLVTLSCEQRRKEIAIRKVNGASIGIILNLFFKEYLFLLIIASLVAFPLGYFIMKQWLEKYVKQTSIDFWIYVSIFIIMAFIIFSSVIWRVWKAACQNPAEVIKNE